jgi:uncharacterized protein HemX
MKKVVTFLVCTALFSSSITFTIMSPKRLWQCRPTNQNPTPPCSAQERATSRKWLVGGTATVIGSILAALGIAVAVSDVKREQAAAQQQPSPEVEKAKQSQQVDPVNQQIISNLKDSLEQAEENIEVISAMIVRTPEEQTYKQQRLENAQQQKAKIAAELAKLEANLR